MIKVEDSHYTQGNETTKGVKLTTQEEFEIDGKKWNKFHTTRVAIVQRFDEDSEWREDINSGTPYGLFTCEKQISKAGRRFFNIVDSN